jgi:hypothetical protein
MVKGAEHRASAQDGAFLRMVIRNSNPETALVMKTCASFPGHSCSIVVSREIVVINITLYE